MNPCITCSREECDCRSLRVIACAHYKSKPITRADRMRQEMQTDRGLATLLVTWSDEWGEYDTPVGHKEDYEEAVKKTIEFLQQPAEEE